MNPDRNVQFSVALLNVVTSINSPARRLLVMSVHT